MDTITYVCLGLTALLFFVGSKLSPHGNDEWGFNDAARMLVWSVVTVVSTLLWLVWAVS